MTRNLALTLPVLLLAACSPDLVSPDATVLGADPRTEARAAATSGAVALVTGANDDGEGSFRAAIARANVDPAVTRIEFAQGARRIMLQQSVEFTGPQDLVIIGRNAILDASAANGPAFKSTGSGDLSIEALTVTNAPSEGLTVELPANATGTVVVRFDRVQSIGNAGHGILIDDQAFASAASLDVRLNDVRFVNNGYSVSDRDGLRVNEGGAGSLAFTATGTRAEDNAADGIELDERGEGDVILDVTHSAVLRNGSFDPEDLDDGFDVDEEGAGSIVGALRHVTASDNFQQGLDFNENDAGDLRVDLYFVQASGNVAEGIEYEEDDDFAGGGDIVTTMRHIIASGNGGDGQSDAGLKLREKGAGNLVADLEDVVASGNVGTLADDEEPRGIFVREDEAGNLELRLANTKTIGNEGHGIDIDENGDGSVSASVLRSVSNENGASGVRADEGGNGSAVVELTGVVTQGNAGGETAGNVVPTIGK